MAQGFEEAALVGLAGAGDVESGAVIDGGADHGEADGDVHACLQAEDLYGTMALIVIHGDHHVEIAARGAEEQCVGGKRAFDVPSTGSAGVDGGNDFSFLFAVAEDSVLAGVGIDTANADFSPGDSGVYQD